MKLLAALAALAFASPSPAPSTSSAVPQVLTPKEMATIDDTMAQINFGITLFFAIRSTLKPDELAQIYGDELKPLARCFEAVSNGVDPGRAAMPNFTYTSAQQAKLDDFSQMLQQALRDFATRKSSMTADEVTRAYNSLFTLVQSAYPSITTPAQLESLKFK